MRQVLQPRHILIELAIGSPLDHALLRQLVNVLPHDTEMRCQLYAGHKRRGIAIPAALPLWPIRRRRRRVGHHASSPTAATMLPSSILRFNALDHPLKILPIKLAPQRRPVGIVTLRNRTLTPAARLFIECVHRTAA
jgi:DNA-binding transcriptional LysR family regulator